MPLALKIQYNILTEFVKLEQQSHYSH